jgi:hypothetical protein
MAFSSIVGDEKGAVQDHESELLRWSVCYRRSWPITLAAPEKDVIDFWNLSIQSSWQRSHQLHVTL